MQKCKKWKNSKNNWLCNVKWWLFCCEDDTQNIGKYFINDFYHDKDYALYIVCYIDEFGHKVSGEYTHDVGIRPAMRFSTFYEENPDLKFSRITSELLEVYKNNDEVWIEEKSLKWLIDEKQDIMLCKNII